MRILFIIACLLEGLSLQAQDGWFMRSELAPDLFIPWDIEFAPDGYLYVSESQGRIRRIHPETGGYQWIWKAPDYRDAAASEQWPLCYKPMPGSGCLGLALDPDFTDTPWMYLFYSYHDSSSGMPKTHFKVAAVRLNQSHDTVVEFKTIVKNIPTGLDHFGGRLLCTKRNGRKYLFVTVGDHGISETSQPSCYTPQDSNPNNLAWNPNALHGKILRYFTNGEIPPDNPFSGNPVYSRGHRNPQGLTENPATGIIYETEHGDRTDDEINLIKPGLNYGWKWVRGWHWDNNYSGEADSVLNYRPVLTSDRLEQPLFVWCVVGTPTSNNNAEWCTVAPSGVAYYGEGAIPFLQNSLLVTTLKNGFTTKQEVQCIRLTASGSELAKNKGLSNPLKLFSDDATINGRLRDIAISPDGRKLFLINNGGQGSARDKVIVYTYHHEKLFAVTPNPARDQALIYFDGEIRKTEIYNINGQLARRWDGNNKRIDLSSVPRGFYVFSILDTAGTVFSQKLIID